MPLKVRFRRGESMDFGVVINESKVLALAGGVFVFHFDVNH